jgi:hypothetical protein
MTPRPMRRIDARASFAAEVQLTHITDRQNWRGPASHLGVAAFTPLTPPVPPMLGGPSTGHAFSRPRREYVPPVSATPARRIDRGPALSRGSYARNVKNMHAANDVAAKFDHFRGRKQEGSHGQAS